MTHPNPVDLVCDWLAKRLEEARRSAQALAKANVMSESFADRNSAQLYGHQFNVLGYALADVERARINNLMRVGREGWLGPGGLYIPPGANLTTEEQLTNFGFLPVFTVDRIADSQHHTLYRKV